LPKKFGDRKLTPLAELALESRDSEFVKRAIQDEVYETLFHQREGHDTLLESAIRRARDDVRSIITSADIHFIDNATDHLDAYIGKIQKTIEIYLSSVGKTFQTIVRNI
jgi:hypothetical protein